MTGISPPIRNSGKCVCCGEYKDHYYSFACGHPMCGACADGWYNARPSRNNSTYWRCPTCRNHQEMYGQDDLFAISIENNRLAAQRTRENGTRAQKKERAKKDKNNKKRLARKLRAISKRNESGGKSGSGGSRRPPPAGGDLPVSR